MKTLLVISPHSGLAAAVRAALDPESYRVVLHAEPVEDQLLRIPSSIDVCIMDGELTSIEPIRAIERIRRRLPQCPLILYTGTTQWEWEEEAYLLGVTHILSKPVRARLLESILERLTPPAKPVPERAVEPQPAARFPADFASAQCRMLEPLRNYSTILGHSLSAEELLKEFLLLLREIIGVNRAAIFLRPPPGSLVDQPEREGAHRLHCACAIGLTPGLLEHFDLTLEAGIGGQVFRSGRIVRRGSHEVASDPQMEKEFELLSAQVAIPVLDRETLVGLAVFDGRVTGEPLSNEELALLFHVLEQLGIAIKNIWFHEQLASNYEMLARIVRHLDTGCVVVARDLTILHVNEMAFRCFGQNKQRPDQFDFNDFPQAIGSRLFEVLKSGKGVAGYRYALPDKSGRTLQVGITPFQRADASAPNSALVVIEDVTQSERIQQLEIEAAGLRLVKQMAERLAHEVGNAVVPISTHQQLLKERLGDPEFQESLSQAMDEGVKRVMRLVEQMRFLARDRIPTAEPVAVKQLIEEAFRLARYYHPSSSAVMLQFESTGPVHNVSGDRLGLKHAFAEVILNALQAGEKSREVHVKASEETDATGLRWARIEVQDGGHGFTPAAASKASEPFYTTRDVGLGLGLAVTDKIVQTHHGRMEIPPPKSGQPGLVRILLPIEAEEAPRGKPAGIKLIN